MNSALDGLKLNLKKVEPDHVMSTIVDAPFQYRLEMVAYGIGIIVLLLADEKMRQVYRVSLSNTELAAGTLRMSMKKFEDIVVPLDHNKNIIAKAIREKSPQETEDWKYLFAPSLSPSQARLNQAGGGIASSTVYPVSFEGGDGALIFSYYKTLDKIGRTERTFMSTYAEYVGACLSNYPDQVEATISGFRHRLVS